MFANMRLVDATLENRTNQTRDRIQDVATNPSVRGGTFFSSHHLICAISYSCYVYRVQVTCVPIIELPGTDDSESQCAQEAESESSVDRDSTEATATYY